MYKFNLFTRGLILIIILNIPQISKSQVGIGLTNPTAQLTVNEDAIFNESGGDNDFRIESDTQANMFFVDASTNSIGVNTNTPASQFQIVNNGNIGANALADSSNSGIDGVALSGFNSSTTNGYNSIEGITNYSGTAFIPAGVFGLAINASLTSLANGVYGFSNGRDGIGVFGGRLNGTGVTGWGGLFINDLGYTGFFGAASDRKLKTNINTLQNSLSIINQLNPVTYNFNLDKYPNMGLNTEMEYGFIAQEIKDILPEIVRNKKLNLNASKEIIPNEVNRSNIQEFLVMDYTRLIPILTRAIQEQQTIIETQNSKIETLETKLESLEHKVNTLIETNQD
ncbi:tail fiber domain-containing protein [Olleya sp. YS]|uniref:tail fiber domain-containing protein n=1 Tax=Olleya sp. YS TaxID=3028318 RepID=UPI0024340E32|nr:tail fiber domain-containing protein [Olleya sp. YS]WGD34328.1 tail fiber domain-containing protein [Olleya sp. YS]